MRTDGPMEEITTIFNSELPVETPSGNTLIREAIQMDYPSTTNGITNKDVGSWNGLELNLIVAGDSCATMNHREAREFSDASNLGGTGAIVKIPGLYPRWIDLKQGGPPDAPNDESCLVYATSDFPSIISGRPPGKEKISNWATHMDRFCIDLYNTGGATGLAPKNQPGATFQIAHAVQYYLDFRNSGNDPQLPVLPTNGFCVIVNPNRCNGQCDMAKFEENR